MYLFRDAGSYRTRYLERLQQLNTCATAEGDPALMLLALANAYSAPATAEALLPVVVPAFRRFVAVSLLPGDAASVALAKIAANDLGNLHIAEVRPVGEVGLHLQEIRRFRERRMAAAQFSGIRFPFDPAGFNFTNPKVQKELVDELHISGLSGKLFFNAFPFAECHTLFFPNTAEGWEQYLDRARYELAWDFAALANNAGCSVGYNSVGGFASINHFHLQVFLDTDLPAAAPRFRHNGGDVPYPTSCDVFDSLETSWQWLLHRHSLNEAYNLLFYRGKVFCFARRHQCAYRHSDWTTGFAFFELAGGIIVTTPQHFAAIDAGMVESEYRLVGG